MKRQILFIVLILITICVRAQKFEQKIIFVGNEHKVVYNGKNYTIDTSIYIVKINDEKYLRENYDVVRYNKLGYADVRKPKDVTMDNFVSKIVSDDKITEACYNTFGEYCSFTPNDILENAQWALGAINVRSAWDFTKGSPNVKVGVLDSGLDWTHEDIGAGYNYNSYQNVYLNPGEDAWTNANTPNTGNHLDDDNNGRVDDWKGWNFALSSNDVRTGNEHGTNIVGIIAAKTNNLVGIAGVAGGNGSVGSQIIFCGVGVPVDASAVDDAIIYAVDMGARIINMSFTIDSTSCIESAIQYAVNNNVILIASSGNNGEENVLYPARNNNVIAVGASNINNHWLNFSNYGGKISVVAPGDKITTTHNNNTYSTLYNKPSGTSVAAPHVSGVAALMLSANPNLTATQVRTIIEQTAQRVHDDVYTYTNHSNGLWNNKMGYGLIDAHKAVMEAYFYNHTIEGDYQLSSCGEYEYSVSGDVPDCASLTWELSDNLEEVSRQGTEITVRPIGYGAGWIKASFEHEGYTITRTKNVNVTSGYITYYNNYTTNGPMTIGSTSVIAGTFTISNGSTVTISSIAKCSPNAKIIILPGGKLVVNGGSLTNLCTGKMWDGIYVVGNKTQRQLAQYQGTLEVKNNAVIENAKCALHNWDGSNANTAGGIVKVTSGSILRNNGVAADFIEYTNTDATGAPTNDESTFSRSSFVIDGYNLLSGNNLTFENFIRMQGTKGISISGCNMRDARTSPDANTKGIYAEGAGFTVTSYCNGAYNSSICACTGTETPTKFSRLGNGVNAVNGGTNYTFKVEKSVFDTCYRAIYVNAVNNYHVTQNDFDMNTYPTFPTNTSSSGLNSNFSSGFKVEANNFYANYATHPSILFDRGIYMSRSGSDVNKIYRNTLSRFYYAIQTSGDNSGLQMLCNEYSNNFVNDEFISGNISSSQGLSTKSAGNKFTLGLSRNISTNTSFTYYHSGYAISTNMFYPATSSSVTKVPNITANDCASTLCNYLPPINPPINPKSSPASDDITLYESLQQEYDSRLAEYDAAGYGFLLENFDEEDADIVALARLKQDTLVSIRRTMAEIANRNIDAILQDTLIFDREALNGWYNRINTQTAKYSLVNSYFEVGEYALARQELASIPQRFALTTDELAEYDNFCQYEALRESVYSSGRNYAQLTEDEIAELQTIVERNTGVSSAYANSVLCFFYGICMDEEIDTDYYFNMDAPLNSKRTTAVTESETEQFAIYVYPNPANEELNILLNSLPEGRTTIEFHDVTGRLVLSEEIKGNSTSINISSLRQGVYMYRIVNGDNVIARDRIVKE